MKTKRNMIQLIAVAVIVLLGVSCYAGWRQEPENKLEVKGDSRDYQRPTRETGAPAVSGPQQPAPKKRDLRDSGQRPVSSGFRLDSSRSDPVRKKPSYQLDTRHHHRRYYPRQGTWIKTLPHGSRVVQWHDSRYFFFGGSWYLSGRGGFFVALPPVGLLVPFLPSFYTTVWVGSVPYYYAGGVYYVWEPVHKAYRVAEPPADQEIVDADQLPERLFIYPTQGQSEQKQATDRYECHSWATSQAGFDPTLPPDDVPASEIKQRGADYNRAMKACLVARGYSVE